MKLPSTIKIGPHVYTVNFPHQFAPGQDLAGQVVDTTLEIQLTDNNDGSLYQPSQVWETFIHEIIHCVGKQIRCGVLYDDEEVINRLSAAILGVLVDNGWLTPELPTTGGKVGRCWVHKRGR